MTGDPDDDNPAFYIQIWPRRQFSDYRCAERCSALLFCYYSAFPEQLE